MPAENNVSLVFPTMTHLTDHILLITSSFPGRIACLNKELDFVSIYAVGQQSEARHGWRLRWC